MCAMLGMCCHVCHRFASTLHQIGRAGSQDHIVLHSVLLKASSVALQHSAGTEIDS